LLAAVLVVTGCSPVDDTGLLSPASKYRKQQYDRALEGVSVVDGRIVAEPAPALPPDAVAVLIDEVDHLLATGYRPEAIGRAVAAVRGVPHESAPYLALGRALLTTGRSEVALAALTSTMDRDPTNTEALFLSGVTLDRLGRREDAMAAWQHLLDIDPTHGAAHARLATTSYLTGDVEAAIDHLAAAQAEGAPVPAHLAIMLDGGDPPAATVVEGHPAGEGEGTGESASVGPQVRINPTIGSTRANETSAAAGYSGEVVAGWNDYSSGGTVRTGIGVSLDGETWSDQVVRAPAANQSGVEGDPMATMDPRTGTVWAGAISFAGNGGLFVARKPAGTTTFEPSVLTLASGSADKGWMAAGPQPGLPDTTRLFVAYNHGLQRSDDLGDTWSSPVSLGTGVGFLPRVGPDGTVYVAYWDYFDGHMLRRSYDGGQTMTAPVRMATLMDVWQVQFAPQIPGDFRVPNLSSIAVDPVDGTLYCVYFDTTEVVGGNSDVDLYLTRSDDDGDTWTTPMVINEDPDPPGDQFFPWLEVSADGRLHLLYFDSSLVVQNDTASTAWLDAFYAWSDDRGSTWTAHRLTGSSFATALTNIGTGEFIGDYNGMAVLGDRVWPVYLSTEHGVPGVYSHEIRAEEPLFEDGFESGDTTNWSNTVP
jgi:hypothetical protein